jgi:adenine-specific DNA-methyltransferase
MVKAYRDTWMLGVHSYLTYLRDRLILCRELLADSGSIFVQIGDENMQRVRGVMEEVLGANNFIAGIVFTKTITQTTELLPSVFNHVLWYAKQQAAVQYKQLYNLKSAGEIGATRYGFVELLDGTRRRLTSQEQYDLSALPAGSKVFTTNGLTSQEYRTDTSAPFEFQGVLFPGK